MSGTLFFPVRIEISHPLTDAPTWLQEWDGKTVTTTHLPSADPDSGNIRYCGGYAFDDAWEEVFCDYLPGEVAEEIMDLHHGAGFNARLLPADRK